MAVASTKAPAHGIVDQTQFGVLGQVLDRFLIGCAISFAQDPSQVGPPKAPAPGGVDILFRIGKFMVVAVMGGPPKGALLGAGGAPKGQHELEKTAGLVGAVGEVTVIGAGDGEHAGVVHEQTHGNCGPTEARKDRQYTKRWTPKKPILPPNQSFLPW